MQIRFIKLCSKRASNLKFQKISFGVDQMYMERKFDSEDDERSAKAVGDAWEIVPQKSPRDTSTVEVPSLDQRAIFIF